MTSQYTGGRFRQHNREEIAQKLVEWALKEDSINLNGFCAQNFIVPQKISEWSKQDDYFREAYYFAKACLADRRERLLSSEQLHVKAYDLNARTYDYFMNKQKDEEVEHEVKVKAKEINASSETQINSYSRMMDQLDDLRKSFQKRSCSSKEENN